MNPSKAWAMLAPRGLRPGGQRGGIPQLTAAEIARMLDGLDRGPFLMGMAIEAGDIAVIPDLERCMQDEIHLLEREYEWRVSMEQRDKSYRPLAALAVFEALVPRPEPCPTCNSRGYTSSHAQPVPCAKCGQTGGQPLSAHRRAYLTGIAWTSWREQWAVRYERIYAAACGWHGDALRHLSERLTLVLTG